MPTKIQKVYIFSFLFTLHVALAAYVNSSFLTEIISEKYVGLLYTIGSLITLLLLVKNSALLKYFGNKRLIVMLLIVNMIAIAGLIGLRSPYAIALAFISMITTNTLISLCLDIFVEHFGNPKNIGRTRSIYLTVTNLAWLISPMITALLISKHGGYTAVYSIAFLAASIMILGLVFSVKTFKDKQYTQTPILEAYRYLKTNKHMFAITVINFLLQFFYSWMVVYTPIYLHEHLGFNWDQMGVIFTAMLAPFVIFGLPVGILIDKYHVKKRTLLYVGFTILILSTLSISFVGTASLSLWALILFLTRMGAAIIETTAETYFFTHVKEEDSFLLGIFRDVTPTAYIIAPIIATLVFMILPFKALFAALSIILLAGYYYIHKLKHTHDTGIPDQNQ